VKATVGASGCAVLEAARDSGDLPEERKRVMSARR
jgi:hypothetical protein